MVDRITIMVHEKKGGGMKVYKMMTGHDDYKNHCVVAESLADAERIFLVKHKGVTIKAVELYSEYVQIQGLEE